MSKGISVPFAHTAELILGILGLVVAYQVVTGIHVESIEPGRNQVIDAIESFNGQTVTIGSQWEGDNLDEIPEVRKRPSEASLRQDAEAQMRGLIAFNMLTAINCNTLTFVDAMSRGDATTEEGYNVRHFYKGSDGSKHPFNAVVNQTNLDPNCYGAEAIDIDPVENAIERINPFSGPEGEQGMDMEGKFGRINFNISSTFLLGDGDRCSYKELNSQTCGEILMGLNMPTVVNNYDAPSFFNGNRLSVFVPGGLTNDGEETFRDMELYHDEVEPGRRSRNWPDNDRGEGGKDSWNIDWLNDHPQSIENLAKMYAYRIRMTDVPAVVPSDPNYMIWKSEHKEGISRDANDWANGADFEGRFEKFVEQAQWLFCEGSEGFVQSNARYINSEDEASKVEEGVIEENVVYPEVKLTDEERCLNTFWDENVDGSWARVSSKINGEKCTVEEARRYQGPESSETVTESGFVCALEREDVSFGRFSGEVEVYRPKWFKKCTELTATKRTHNIINDYVNVRGTGDIEGEADSGTFREILIEDEVRNERDYSELSNQKPRVGVGYAKWKNLNEDANSTINIEGAAWDIASVNGKDGQMGATYLTVNEKARVLIRKTSSSGSADSLGMNLLRDENEEDAVFPRLLYEPTLENSVTSIDLGGENFYEFEVEAESKGELEVTLSGNEEEATETFDVPQIKSIGVATTTPTAGNSNFNVYIEEAEKTLQMGEEPNYPGTDRVIERSCY